MNKEAYSVWISLFDESIASTWLSEPQVELKNAAMVLCVLKKEFQGIKNALLTCPKLNRCTFSYPRET